MENIKLQNQNIIDSYQPTPNMYYDVEGTVVSKEGKNLVIEKQTGFEVVEYTLNLKEEKDVEVGEEVKIEKEEINSMKLEKQEKIPEQDIEDIGKVLKSLGLQNTTTNVMLVNKLIKQGIKPTKINVENYMRNMDNLDKIESNFSLDNLVKVLDKDIDLEELNLEEVIDLFENVEEKEVGFLDLFKRNKDLSYKEAENISKKIFGQKMGKDVYDIIISLDREGLDITRENVEKSLDILNKLSDIKKLETVDYVQIMEKELDFTINNLFKVKNNYTINALDENKFAKTIESLTIEREVDFNSLLEVLKSENLDSNTENINLAREFLLMDLDIEKDKFNIVKSMRESVEYIKENLTKDEISRLLNLDIDLLNKDIDSLKEIIKSQQNISIEGSLESDFLEKIEDKDLLQLLKSGKEFKLTDLKEIVTTGLKDDNSIEFKVFDRINKYDDMLKFIGEKPDLKYIEYKEEMSLKDMYNSLNVENPTDIKSINKKEIDFLMNEYDKFRENIDSKIIKKSIQENINLDEVSLKDANNYMENRVNRYKKASEIMKEFNTIYRNKESIIPVVINNQLDMNYKSIKEIGQYLGGEKGISKVMETFSNSLNSKNKQDFKSKREEISKDIKLGKDIRDEYVNLMNFMDENSSDLDKNKEDKNKYFEIRNKISKNDLVMQLPVDIDGFKDLNMIVPNISKGINKNFMSFKLGIETKKLGNITMDLEVSGKDIFLNANESALDNYYEILGNKFKNIGYNLVLRR